MDALCWDQTAASGFDVTAKCGFGEFVDLSLFLGQLVDGRDGAFLAIRGSAIKVGSTIKHQISTFTVAPILILMAHISMLFCAHHLVFAVCHSYLGVVAQCAFRQFIKRLLDNRLDC